MKNGFKLLSLLTVSALLLTSCGAPNPLRGKVYMKDGSVRMGMIGVPSPTTKTVGLVPAGQDKTVKLASQDVSYIEVWHEKAGEDKASKLMFTSWIELDKKGNKKMSKKKIWMINMVGLPYIAAFATGEGYLVHSDGSASTYTSTNSIGAPDIWYYLQRPNEEVPTKIALSNIASSIFLPANRFFKRWGPHYFSDCPELVEKIKNKDVKVRTNKELAAVILLYGDCKGQARPKPKTDSKSQEKEQPTKKK